MLCAESLVSENEMWRNFLWQVEGFWINTVLWGALSQSDRVKMENSRFLMWNNFL
ncbi:hypothetical protein EJP617_A130 (plasmid) [Erwinia sp. Ejp617]|nr:hypothetical protein EJP617_A130 [Erwinia sp. Ejp617]